MKKQQKPKRTMLARHPEGSKRAVAVWAIAALVEGMILVNAVILDRLMIVRVIVQACFLATVFQLGRHYERVKRDGVKVWIDTGE